MATFQDIIGQEQIIEHLQTAVKTQKVSHAYILQGERSAGKEFIAKIFAAALQCEKQDGNPCGECRSCKQAESGNQPDIIRVSHEKPNTIGVEDIRKITGDIAIKPYSSSRKIYIVNEAEKMTVQAQNGILKTIEEPPEYSVIIFLTNNVDVFLPTIISRCITFNLKPLRESTIMEYLIKEHKIPDYEAKVCASFSQGYLGRAVKLVAFEDFNAIKEEALRFVRNVHTYEVYDLVDEIKRITEYKININDFIDIIQMWYSDVLLCKVTKDHNNLIFRDEINFIRKSASQSSYEGIETILNSCEIAKARIKANVNFDLAMELMLLNIKEN